MSPAIIGFIGVGVLLLAFATGLPIAFSMMLVGFLGFMYLVSPESALTIMGQDIFEKFSSYPLSCIPTFVLMGCYAFAAGIGRKLFGTARTILGQMPGGVAIASIAASAGFGAVCGSSTATSATIGKVALPEMRRFGYDDSLATGVIACSGGLGILIPPSVSLAVYGLLTEQSIGKLFMAGIGPGLVMAGLLMVTVWFLCRRNSALGPPGLRTTWKEKLVSLSGLSDTIILFVLALGGLFAGWFGPTQAGAIGAVGTLAIGLARRQLTWRAFWDATKDGLELSCMIMLLMATAAVFGHFMAVTKIPLALTELMESLALPSFAIMIILFIFWSILGCFIDSMPIMLLLVPIVYPVVLKLGYNPISFGVMVTTLSTIALVTPPVGLNAFVTQAVAKDVPLETVYKGVIPLLIPMFISLFLILAFPQYPLFLPSLIRY